jgi:hypothetical protein
VTKSVTGMSAVEYARARAALIRHSPTGMSVAEPASRQDPDANDVRSLSPNEYAAAKAKAIRSS